MSRLLGAGASSSELAAFGDHLDACPSCRTRLEQLAGSDQVLPYVTRIDSEHPSDALHRLIRTLHESGAGSVPPASMQAQDDANILLPSREPGYLGRFADYDVVKRIAAGGMGVVFKARDQSLRRMVAIKVLAPTLAASETARARFLREARAAAAVAHEHVVAIHAVGEDRGLPFLVMQFVEGRSLQARLAERPLGLVEILRIGRQIALGLAAAHAQGLIHRDVKPGNILLENSVERVKLTDFGLACAVDEPGITRPGVIAGTPEYMSPEQARCERLDARSDLFSLGSVLYAMATGSSPFAAETSFMTLKRVCETEPVLPATLRPELPSWLDRVVHKLLAKNPADRFSSAEHVALVLGEGLAAIQSGAPMPPAEWADAPGDSSKSGDAASRTRKLSPVLAVALTAGVLLALGLFVWKVRTPVALPDPASPRFRLIRSDGLAGQSFASLQTAVNAAEPGGIIEVSGSGELLCDPVVIPQKPLRVRASLAGAPVLVNASRTAPLIVSHAPLILEGLELRAREGDSDVIRWDRPGQAAQLNIDLLRPSALSTAATLSNELVRVSGAPLALTYSRLVGATLSQPGQECVHVENAPTIQLLSSEFFHVPGPALLVIREPMVPSRDREESVTRLLLENCAVVGRRALTLGAGARTLTEIRASRNTIVGMQALSANGRGRITVDAHHNFFDVLLIVRMQDESGFFPPDRLWTGSSNVYGIQQRAAFGPKMRMMDSPQWRQRERLDPGSVFGEGRLGNRISAGAGPANRVTSHRLRLSTNDVATTPPVAPEFLRSVGADVDRLGPGVPYATWRNSPEYSQWLTKTREWMESPPPRSVRGE